MKFYQLNYEFSDNVNYTKYYQSYDKAKASFDKLVGAVPHDAEVINYEQDNKKGSIRDWTWVTINGDKVLDVSIMVKETED